MQEIRACRIGSGKNALQVFLNQWDAAGERLVQAGTQEGDAEVLYVHFKPNFMACPELNEQAAKIRRSLPGPRVHTYEWMYKTAKARIETMRLESQEAERLASSMPGAAQPLTPGLDVSRHARGNAKAKLKAKPKIKALAIRIQEDKKKVGCPRLAK